jgi:thymidylate synthase
VDIHPQILKESSVARVSNSLDELWIWALKDLANGANVKTRDGRSAFEIIGWSGMLMNPHRNFVTNKRRNLCPMYAAGELAWYLAGSDNGDFIKAYAPSYDRFLEADGRAHGAYGKRWARMDQIERVVAVLKKDSFSRQAILSMWEPTDLRHAQLGDKKDVPCTLNIQFLVRGSHLHCITTMRSNDAWIGMPYDIFCFTMLQSLIAEELGLQAGVYQHNVGSLHLYENHCQAATEAIASTSETYEPDFFKDATELTSQLKKFSELEEMHRTLKPSADSFEIGNPLRCGSRLGAILALCFMKHAEYIHDPSLRAWIPDFLFDRACERKALKV